MSNQELSDSRPSGALSTSTIGSAITIGFTSAIIMWMLAWALHMPGVHVATQVAIPILLVPLFLVTFVWIPQIEPSKRIMSGCLAGFIAGLVNLMILGSNIVEQPSSTAEMSEQANELAPNAILIVLGSLAISILIGGIAALIRKNASAANIATTKTWISRLAFTTAISYLPLIAVGGIVTTTDSGLAVPDATTSYGAISVLFPIKLMAEPRIFFEHSHRLFGTLAGLTTLVLMVRVLMSEPRKIPKLLAVILFIAVSLQGYMGIIRVAEESTFFAIIHGIFAQLVLALACVTSIMLSEKWNASEPAQETNDAAKKARTMLLLAFLALCVQLILGAVTRHLNSSHAMMAHMGFAFIAMMLVIIGGAVCIRTGKAHQSGKPIRIYGALLHGLVVLQFTLGFAVLGLAWEGEDAPTLPTAENLDTAAPIETIPALVTTLHHITGALVLAAAAGALVWSFKLATRSKIR
ncbi:MAG: COX15/CtaA family protein [Phycisphaerales bacterium]|nr:COX15/CtaA family protein [Phycisphaerales bacterium]